MSKSALAWLAIAFLVGGGFMIFIAGRQLANRTRAGGSNNAIVWPPEIPADSQAEWMNSFTLVERSGKEVTSESLKGAPYVASFFFSTCTGTCIRQNQLVSGLVSEFKGTPVKFVSITTDPMTDTPEKLRGYALQMQAPADRWYFLTGNAKYIRRVAAELFFTATSEDGKTHGSKMLLVDRDGKLIGAYGWEPNDELKRLKDAIRAAAAGEDIKEKGLLPLPSRDAPHNQAPRDEEEDEEATEEKTEK